MYAEPSPFPPSFEGNPWGYAFALFGDVVAPALALAILLSYIFEGRRNREVSRQLNNWLPSPAPLTIWSPLHIYRIGKMSFLSFVIMRTLPDAVWMLVWGEVSDWWIKFCLGVDLWMDGLAIIPFCVASFCWAWGRQVIPQKLMEGNMASVKGGPPWDIIIRNGKIVLAVFVIAIGVTIGKAHA